MFFKTGIKFAARAGKKSLLFFGLTALVTLCCGLGTGMYFSAQDMISACENEFITLAVFEYSGNAVSDNFFSEPKALAALGELDTGAIRELDGVKWIAERKSLPGTAADFVRPEKEMPFPDEMVLAVKVLVTDFVDGSLCLVTQELWASDRMQDRFVVINFGLLGQNPEAGECYAVTGHRYEGPNAYTYLYPCNILSGDGREFVKRLETDTIPESGCEYFTEAAEAYRLLNSYVTVNVTRHPLWQTEFHQGVTAIKSGEVYGPDEEWVCIVSEDIAQAEELGIGDVIELSVFEQGDGSSEDVLSSAGGCFQGKYTISAVASVTDENRSFVYIPFSEASGLMGQTIAQAVIENGKGGEFLESVRGLLPPGVTVTVFDQGYAGVMDSAETYSDVAKTVMAVSAAAGAAVAVLFGYMFASWQRVNAGIMQDLGTPKRAIRACIVMSAALIVLPAAAVGFAAGAAAMKFAGKLAFTFFSKNWMEGLHYSVMRVGIVKSLTDMSKPHVGIIAAVSALTAAAALTAVTAFLPMSFRKRAKRKQKPVAAKCRGRSSSVWGRGPVRFAFLSVSRGGLRSLVVPCAAAVLTVLLCSMVSARSGYEQELRALRSNTEIAGCITDYRGRTATDIVISAWEAEQLLSFGMVKDFALSHADEYIYRGIAEYADGEPGTLLTVTPPSGGFAYETFISRILQGPKISFTSSLEATTDFFRGGGGETKFAPGYDESLFGEKDGKICVVPDSFMEANGISLGDRIGVYVGTELSEMEFTVVGSFASRSGEDGIYCPLAAYFDTAYLFEENYTPGEEPFLCTREYYYFDKFGNPVKTEYTEEFGYDEYLRRFTFDMMTFSVSGLDRLSEFKAALLDGGWSEPGIVRYVRVYPVFDDREALEAERDLSKQMTYLNILTPLMFLLVCGVGFVISRIMTGARKSELAVMRGLGAPEKRVFASFFLEQAALCLAGAAAGLIFSLVLNGAGAEQFAAAGALVPVFCAGAAIALRAQINSKLLALPAEEE